MLRYILYVLFVLFIPRTYSQNDSLKIISWNIRDFGKTKDSGELELIADIVETADIVAIQEVVAGYGGPQGVARLCKELETRGGLWDYAISEATVSPKYMTERYAFLWKSDKVKSMGRGRLLSELNKQVDREPFLMRFEVGNHGFILFNYHSGHSKKNPEVEIRTISQYIRDTFKQPHIILGDFNMSEGNAALDILFSAGYVPLLVGQKTTLKRSCDRNEYLNAETDNVFYSQEIKVISGGVIDYVKRCEQLSNSLTISDHLPVYLTLKL